MNDEDTDGMEYDSGDSELYFEEEDPNPYGTRTTKGKIRRRGLIQLNLTSNYGGKSGWGVREGIRELLQNFADNVRENDDGTPREVDWVFESTDGDRVQTYIAYAQGTRPRPNARTKLHNRQKALGYIIHRRHECRFILVNKNTCLSRRVWSMGETSKGGSEHHIGGHGDGMKVGIIALLRYRAKVTYYTNREIWDWCFHDFQDSDGDISNLLTINLAPYQPNKAKKDPMITEDVRVARRTAKKDTTVIVQGYRDLDIRFNDYLFLVNPPPDTLFETKLGTILTGDEYRSKIFVKGIFVEQRGANNPPGLVYGVNFNKVALDRDRRSLMTESQVAETLSEIWNDLIERDQGMSVDNYLELLMGNQDSLETLKADDFIHEISAKKLFEKLKSMFPPETFFFNGEDKSIAETIRIIKDCLQRKPKSIPRRLYEIFFKYDLITTPKEERLRLFSKAPIVIQPMSDPWVEHTIRAFDYSLIVHPPLKDCKYLFRHAPPTVEIDVIHTESFDGDIQFQLHDRWLDFTQAHEYRQSCPLWQGRQISEADEDAVCDCAVEKLFDLVLNEIEELSGAERQKLGYLCKDLLNSMPRHLSAVSNEVEPGKIETEITWDTSTSKYFKTSFDVFVYASDYGSVAKSEHRFHDVSDPAVGANKSPLHSPDDNVPSTTQTTSQTVPDESSPESSPEVSGDDQNQGTVTDYLWREKAEHSRSITIKCPHPTLSPGKKYIALIRPTKERQSFYSAPFEFEIQCPTPQNVQVEKVDSRIHVTWDFPLSNNVKFRVFCESMFDVHHQSALLEERLHSFEVDLDVLSEELKVMVEAESEDGVKSSRSTPVKVPPEEMYTTSPSEESEDDFEDVGCLDNRGWHNPSPSMIQHHFARSRSSSSSNIRESITVEKPGVTVGPAPRRGRSASQKKTNDRLPSDLPPQSSATTKSNAQAEHAPGLSSRDLNHSQQAATPNARLSIETVKERVADAVRKGDLNVVSAKQIRMTVEDELNLPRDHLKKSQWRKQIEEEIDKILAEMKHREEGPDGEESEGGFANTYSEEQTRFGDQLPLAAQQPTSTEPNESEIQVELESALAPNFGRIDAGRAYVVEDLTSPTKSAAVEIHRIFEKSGNIYLLVCGYWFLGQEGKKILVLMYLDWDHAGQQSEWYEVPLKGLRVIRPCRINSFLHRSPRVTFERDDTELSYFAGWGMTLMPFELRKLRNRSGNVEVDQRDIKRLPERLRVHNYNCGSGGFTCGLNEAGLNVVLGTEADQLALKSWKVTPVLLSLFDEQSNHGGNGSWAIPEGIEAFLDRYADRVQKSYLDPPSVVVISNLTDSGQGCCESNKTLIRVMDVINAPMILSDYPFDIGSDTCKCMRRVIEALVDHDYECRYTKFQAADYGPVRSQERYILLASKIGLPKLPGKFEDSELGAELRVQGFKQDYKVYGSAREQIRQIRDDVPPPLANAIGFSIYSHWYKLREGMKDCAQMQDIDPGSRKRSAEDDGSQEGSSKRAHRE